MLSIFSLVYWASVCFLWNKVYSGSLPLFHRVVCFLKLVYMNYFYILYINPLLDILPAICSLIKLTPYIDVFLQLCKSILVDVVPFIFFCCPCLRRWIQNILLRLMPKTILPWFSSRSFMLSGLTFKSLDHFPPIYFWCEKVVQSNSYPWGCPIFPIPFIKEAVFSLLYILASIVVDKSTI